LAYLDGKQFNELPPPKDWNERMSRASSTVISAANKLEQSLIQVGDKLDKKIEEKGWKNKFDTFIAKKFRKSSTADVTESQRAAENLENANIAVSTPYIDKP
jgi:hypothetical protein